MRRFALLAFAISLVGCSYGYRVGVVGPVVDTEGGIGFGAYVGGTFGTYIEEPGDPADTSLPLGIETHVGVVHPTEGFGFSTPTPVPRRAFRHRVRSWQTN